MQQAITIKLRLVEDVGMADFQRQFNNVLHYAYNRALEGVAKYDVFAMLGGLRNVDDLALLPKECPFEHDPDTTLAIDMNPNYVGLSIVRGDTVVLTRAYDLSKVKGSNKRKYELTQVVLAIKGLCRHWRVSYVGIEKLVMAPKNKGRSRRFNRQVNNEWCRGHFVASLQKHMCLVGCKVVELVAAYSSFIGCLTYPSETDSVAASIELNRRLMAFVDQYVVGRALKGSVVYPVFEDGCLNRWKEDGIPSEALTGWKAAYRWLSESRHSWRLTYGAYAKRERLTALRLQSRKSLVTWISGGKGFPCLG